MMDLPACCSIADVVPSHIPHGETLLPVVDNSSVPLATGIPQKL